MVLLGSVFDTHTPPRTLLPLHSMPPLVENTKATIEEGGRIREIIGLFPDSRPAFWFRLQSLDPAPRHSVSSAILATLPAAYGHISRRFLVLPPRLPFFCRGGRSHFGVRDWTSRGRLVACVPVGGKGSIRWNLYCKTLARWISGGPLQPLPSMIPSPHRRRDRDGFRHPRSSFWLV